MSFYIYTTFFLKEHLKIIESNVPLVIFCQSKNVIKAHQIRRGMPLKHRILSLHSRSTGQSVSPRRNNGDFGGTIKFVLDHIANFPIQTAIKIVFSWRKMAKRLNIPEWRHRIPTSSHLTSAGHAMTFALPSEAARQHFATSAIIMFVHEATLLKN